MNSIADRTWIVWLIVFVYTIAAGLFIQLILLPYLFPAWHWGVGLFRGMDAPQFHQIALALSNQIELEGWNAWVLKPQGQFVSAIVAICYQIIYPAPWSVLPVNAALNATAAVALFLMLDSFLHDRRRSLLAAMPFIFFPSALLWNGQMHNENYAVPGGIFILYGWSLLAGRRNESAPKFQWGAALSIGAGSALVGVVREEILDGLLYLSIGAVLTLSIFHVIDHLRKKTRFSTFIITLTNLGMAIFLMGAITYANSYANRRSYIGFDPATFDPSSVDPELLARFQEFMKNFPRDDPAFKANWEYTSWLPRLMDRKLRDLAVRRYQVTNYWQDSGTAIDLDVQFKSSRELIGYLPRAFQIAFFSPFPVTWFTTGYKITGSAARALSGIEMMVAYFCLVGLPYFVWKNRAQPTLWVVIALCTAMLLVYAIAAPNQGALYRFRFPYYMPLVCMGLAGWLELGRVLRSKRAAVNQAGSPHPDPVDFEMR